MGSGLVLSLRTSTWLFTSPSSSQGEKSKLGGLEESLFEHSLRIGREERPPIAVVVQAQEQVLSSNSLCFNNCV